jgi:hypothetical protein
VTVLDAKDCPHKMEWRTRAMLLDPPEWAFCNGCNAVLRLDENGEVIEVEPSRITRATYRYKEG